MTHPNDDHESIVHEISGKDLEKFELLYGAMQQYVSAVKTIQTLSRELGLRVGHSHGEPTSKDTYETHFDQMDESLIIVLGEVENGEIIEDRKHICFENEAIARTIKVLKFKKKLEGDNPQKTTKKIKRTKI